MFYQTTYNFRDMFTKVVNSHAIKVGGDIIHEQNNDKAPWPGARPTTSITSGASRMTRRAPRARRSSTRATGAFTELQAYARSSTYALFAQDDWKIRPNLTVNLGLRWEYFSPLRVPTTVLRPSCSARIRVSSGPACKRGAPVDPDKNNFGPQVGFAWTPSRFSEKLAVRGGAGIGFNRLPGNRLLEARFTRLDFAGFLLTGNQIVYGRKRHLGLRLPEQPQRRDRPSTRRRISRRAARR